MTESNQIPQGMVRKTRKCQNCVDDFVPWHSGQRYCGNTTECEQIEAEEERESEAARRESAEADNYERY